MEDIEGDEKDDVKRKCRNLSEKKRRDQFNLLINELATMVSANNRKMDKSTVLKATIAFFKNQKEASSKEEAEGECEGGEELRRQRQEWQPSFLSNAEFTHLMLEALDGFIVTLSRSGRILYTSESITPLLGYLPSEVKGCFLSDLLPSDEQEDLRQFLSNPALAPGFEAGPDDLRERYTIAIHVQRGTSLSSSSSPAYERIHLTGYFERYKCPSEDGVLDFSYSEAEDSWMSVGDNSRGSDPSPSPFPPTVNDTTKIVFVAVARLEHPQLLREMIVLEPTKSEFTSRHSLEWKFLFLDHRAPTIIGYLPFEVLGTSGYDYYHVDDLEKVSECHEMLMKKGKGISCFYRFLTKGQQWIWLRSHYYITYHQWNSKPEFVVCTNTVVSYAKIKGNQKEELKEEKLDFESEFHKDELSNNEVFNEASSTRDEAGPSTSSSFLQRQQQSFMHQHPYGGGQQVQHQQQLGHSHQQHQSAGNQQQLQYQASSSNHQLPPNNSSSSKACPSEGRGTHTQQQQMPLPKRHFQLQKIDEEREKVQHRSAQHQMDSSPGSPGSQQSSYSVPLVQHLESSSEPRTWSRRARSVSSQYSSSSAQSDGCMSRAKRFRRQFVYQCQLHQHSRSCQCSSQSQHTQQQQQHKTVEVVHSRTSPNSDISFNSYGSISSQNSLQHLDLAYLASVTSHPERKGDSFSLKGEGPPSSHNAPAPSAAAAGSSTRSSVGHSRQPQQSHLQPQHSTQQYGSEMQIQQPPAPSVSYNSMETGMIGANTRSQNVQSSGSQHTQVVQLAAVPFSPVIPIQPVVSNHLAPMQCVPSATESLRQSLFMNYEQQQIQQQLQKKHSELQEHIIRQQEELRKVNQQLIMAQYGVNLQLVKGGAPGMQQQPQQYAPVGETNSPVSYYHSTDGSNLGSVNNRTPANYSVAGVPINSPMGYSQPQHFVTTTTGFGIPTHIPQGPTVVAPSVQAIGVSSMTLPYELPQHQAQMLFSPQRQHSSDTFQQPQQHQPQSQQ